MEIEFIGNATQLLRHGGTTILCDPWLTDGIWGGSTFHYPPVRATAQELAKKTEYIFISHIHEAHFDKETLKHFSKETPILCLDREPNYVAEAASNLGFEHIIRAPAWEPVNVDGKFQFTSCGTAGNNYLASLIDSTGIFLFDDEVVVHCNDNFPYEPFCTELLSKFGRPDLLLMPPGGGSAYPGMYTNLTHDQKIAKRTSVLAQRQEEFCVALERMQPRYTMPMGGDFLIGGQYSWTNEYTCKPSSHQEVVDQCLANNHNHTEYVILQEGMSFNLSSEKVSGEQQEFTQQFKQDFIDSITDSPYQPFLSTSLSIDDQTLKDLFVSARSRAWSKQQELAYKFDYHMYIDYRGSQMLHLDFSSPTATTIDSNELVLPYIKISVSREDLLALLSGLIPWNTAEGSYRLTFHRDPEVYEERAYEILNFLFV